MKKKFALLLLSITFIFTCPLALSACDFFKSCNIQSCNLSDDILKGCNTTTVDNSNDDANGDNTGGGNNTTPHEHNYIETVVAPTCTEQGYTVHTCGGCGDNYKDAYTAKVPHDYTDTVTDPTCTAQGYTTHTCRICNYNYKNAYIEAVPTNHTYTEAIINPTCTEQGYTLYNCKSCGDTYKDNYTEIDFSNHNYKNGICINCNDIQETENLAYTLNSDGKSYTLYGIGTAYDADYIKIPASYNGKPVTAIRNSAFLSFTSIKQVIIPEGVTSIGNSAFKGCKSLENIIIPDSVTYIGQQAFYNCTNPYLIQTESDGVQYIDKWVIGCDRDATLIHLRENTRGIADEGLAYCSKITDINIPNSVISFGYCSFYYCRTLEKINFEGTVNEWNAITIDPSWNVSTGDYTIYCTDGEIAKDGTIIKNELNQPTQGLVYTLSDDGTYYICSGIGSVTDTDIVIASEYNGKPVTSIGNRAFFYCSSLTSINVPDSVTSIGDSAFYHCTSLISVTLQNSATSIGEQAFAWCTSLTSITIPDNIISICNEAFYHCTSLINITIPNSVTSIGSSAFRFCSSLTSITIPYSVTSIGSSAFSSCTSLTSITIPNSVTTIGNSAFSYCSSLANITVESNNPNYKSIDGNLYSNDGKTLIQYAIGKTDTSFTVPNGVTSISDNAFNECTAITSITIPDSVTSIGNYAFSYCTKLISITIPDSVTSIGRNAFIDCTKIIETENNVQYVDKWAIGCNSSVTQVSLRNDTKGIADSTFSFCSKLTSVTIPDSVTSIGGGAFSSCSSLTSITFEGTVDEWNAIEKSDNWNVNSSSYTVYCTDGEIAKDGTVTMY